jgi:hypothetical protein
MLKKVLLPAAVAALLVLSLVGMQLGAASPYWMNFYGTVRGEGGQPLADARIEVFVDGILAGADTSRADGTYGLLPVYGDDPTTPEKDGARPGDSLSFHVNGHRAGSATWTAHGAVQQLDLQGGPGPEDAGKGCADSYEPNNQHQLAKELTGPELHNFYTQPGVADEDWTWFNARANYVYRIAGRANEVLPTVPHLRLYRSDGLKVAENERYFVKDAEIWWWNDGPDQKMYIQATDGLSSFGCGVYYTLELDPWSPEAFKAHFNQ